jgi:ABC-type lipopolysaccharide export system ATPase subunit
MLQATALSKSFKGRTVVSEVSLGIAQGKAVGLLGPNGRARRPPSTCWLACCVQTAEA